MMHSTTTPIRGSHFRGPYCKQCGSFVDIQPNDDGGMSAECECFAHTVDGDEDFDDDGRCWSRPSRAYALELHQELALENAEQHWCGYGSECLDECRTTDGRYMPPDWSVPLVGCVEGPGIHEAVTLRPEEMAVAS